MPRTDWETDENGELIPENLPIVVQVAMGLRPADPPARAYQDIGRPVAERQAALRDLAGQHVRRVRLYRNELRISTRERNDYRLICVSQGAAINRITCSRLGEIDGCEIVSAGMGLPRVRGSIRSQSTYRYTGRRRITFVLNDWNGQRREVVATFTCEDDRSYSCRPTLRMVRDA